VRHVPVGDLHDEVVLVQDADARELRRAERSGGAAEEENERKSGHGHLRFADRRVWPHFDAAGSDHEHTPLVSHNICRHE
jgi:hypothetical protein